jgi:hypothetical protein
MGFMVFPALEPHESYYIEFQGEGQYVFTYFQSNAAGKWEPLFSILIVLPLGGVGMTREEVRFAVKNPPITAEDAKLVMRALIVPEDLGTPPGALSLRGATNFQTPAGWDTVYTPIFNMIERPMAPSLIVRVETDWYMHETEFRYVLQPGEGFPGAHTMPIGRSSSSHAKRSRCATALQRRSPRSGFLRRNLPARRLPTKSRRPTGFSIARIICGRAARRNRRDSS